MRAQRQSTLRRISIAASLVAIAIGGGHVMAWVTGALPLVPTGTIIMKTNAGLGILAAGLALALVVRPPSASHGRRRLARTLAVFVLLLGLATLCEHFLGWNLRIDQLLASEPVGAAATASPNRMGPPAALSLALLGIALLSLSAQRRGRPLHEAFALPVALLALLSLIGYAYHASQLYATARVTAIAWPTTVSLLALAVGVLCARPEEGLMARVTADDPGGAIVRALLGPIIAVPLVSGWLRLAGERAGWFDAAIGTGLMMVLFIITFASLLFFVSRRLGLAREARRQADEALAEHAARQQSLVEAFTKSDQEFRALIDNVNAGVALIDRTGRFALYNRQFLAMFGLAIDSDVRNINDQDWGAWQVFDERGALLGVDDHPVRKAVITGRGVRDQLVRVRRPDDRTAIWMLVSAQPLAGPDGRPDRIICTYSDVTDRRRAEEALSEKAAELERDIAERTRIEEALRRSEETFEKAFHGNTAAMAVTRLADGTYIEVNDRFVDVTGFSREQTIGQTTAQLNIWKDAHDRAVFVERLRRDGTVRNLECAFQRPRGEEWIGLVSAQVSDIEGEAVVISSFADVTEGKRAELAVRQSEEALRQANARLAEADRRKDEFLAVLSHELRNPLAPIRAALYVLEHAVPGSDQASRARTVIDRQVAQLSRLVDDLLDVTRISRGKIHLHPQPLELNGLVARTAEDHRDLFAARAVALDVEVPDEPLWVRGDEQRLAQVVGNLLQNAAKFTETGERTTVRLSREDASLTALISVRDTGIGISENALQRLFEPFMQVDDTLDRRRGGLGLGLALVKSLVEMHGGTVSAASDGIGRGAEFAIRIPLADAPMVASAAPQSARHRPRRVLIIEDNVDAAESLRDALELAGHRAEVAYDGAEGLEKARRFVPEIVLCDIGLPGMDGYEVAQALRRDDTTRSFYLIALTGYALPEDVAKARAAGFDLHLAKPPNPRELEAALAAAPNA